MEFYDLTIVVRSSGERTYKSLKEQLSYFVKRGACLETVFGSSFELVLQNSYRKAMELGRKWTLIIDSDILISSKFSRLLREDMDRLSESNSVLGFSYKVFDKFYKCPKYRGIHIYLTHHIERALNMIPSEGSELRPETFVKKKLKQSNLIWYNLPQTVGIHDYYQFDKDIFDKYLIRSHRSAKDLVLLKSNCNNRNFDQQYGIVIQALNQGVKMEKVEIKNKRRLLGNTDFKETKSDNFTTISKFHVSFIIKIELFRRYFRSKFNRHTYEA